MSTTKGHYTNPNIDDDELIDPDDGRQALKYMDNKKYRLHLDVNTDFKLSRPQRL